MRTRWLALAPALVLVLTTSAHAAPTTVPQIKDAPNDAVGGQASMDIASVLYTTAGTGSGKAYKAKELVVTMTLAGPPVTTPGISYEATATTTACGDVTFTYEPGTPYERVTGLNGWAQWGSCDNGSGNIELLTVRTAGNTVNWEFAIKGTPFKLGTVFSAFRAQVDLTEPVVPFPASETQTNIGVPDAATGSGTWKLG